jgi:hypothetical protein
MTPGLTYTVPTAGWSSLNRTAAPGNFHLFPPGGSMSGFADGTTDAITVYSAVVPPGRCTGQPSEEFAGTFKGLMEFIQANPRILVTDVRDASVGGLEGKAMDVAYVEADGCSDGDYVDLVVGVDPSHGGVGLTSSTLGLQLYLLHLPGNDRPLAIAIDDAKNGGSDYGDGEPWLDAAEGVIDTFVITP